MPNKTQSMQRNTRSTKHKRDKKKHEKIFFLKQKRVNKFIPFHSFTFNFLMPYQNLHFLKTEFENKTKSEQTKNNVKSFVLCDTVFVGK